MYVLEPGAGVSASHAHRQAARQSVRQPRTAERYCIANQCSRNRNRNYHGSGSLPRLTFLDALRPLSHLTLTLILLFIVLLLVIFFFDNLRSPTPPFSFALLLHLRLSLRLCRLTLQSRRGGTMTLLS